MDSYDKLAKILDKEIISIKELREISNNDLVAEVKEIKSDNKYKNLPKYTVTLQNGELYFIYIKKSLFF